MQLPPKLSEQNKPYDHELVVHGRKTPMSCSILRQKNLIHPSASLKHYASTTRLDEIEDSKDHPFLNLSIHASALWKHCKASDLVIQLNGKDYPAHKQVIRKFSKVLKGILDSGEPAKYQTLDHIDILNLDEYQITDEALAVLLYQMYTGKLKATCQNAGDVYLAARRLGIQNAVEQCETIFRNPENPITLPLYVYATAKKIQETVAADHALQVMCRNFERIICTTEYLYLNVDQVCEFLSQDELGCRSEVIVFLAALKWLSVDFAQRERYTQEVMSCVRFPMMTLKEVISCQRPPILPVVVKIPAVSTMLLRGTCYIAARMVNETDKFKAYACRPRIYLVKMKPVILTDSLLFDSSKYSEHAIHQAAEILQAHYRGYRTREDILDLLEGEDRKINTRSTKKENPVFCSFLRVPVGNQSSTFDGDSVDTEDDLTLTDKVLKLNMDSGVILAFGMSDFGSSKRSSKVSTMFSMMQEQDQCRNVLRYVPALNEWSEFAEMPFTRNHMCAVYLDDKIYCIGGCDTTNVRSEKSIAEASCSYYDMSKKKWSKEMPSMNYARKYHGADVINGVIYVAGGMDEEEMMLDSIECYTPGNGFWKEMKMRMCNPRMGFGICAHRNQLWIVGGMVFDEFSKQCIVRDVELYDPLHDKMMSNTPKLPMPLGFPALADCNDKVFSIGGMTYQGDDKTQTSSVSNVYVFDRDIMKWKDCSPIPSPKHLISAVTFGACIFAVSGKNEAGDKSTTKEVFCYDVLNNTWKHCSPLPNVYSGSVSAVLIPKLT